MLTLTIICTFVAFKNVATWDRNPVTSFLKEKYNEDLYETDVALGMIHRDMIPWFLDKPPKQLCNLTWGSRIANVGNIYLRHLVELKPSVSWKDNSTSLHTLIFTFLDPNLDPWSFNETNHWLVTNIPKRDVSRGQEILAYKKPENPTPNVYYQYVLLIYKQPGSIDVQFDKKLSDNATRQSFTVKEFAKKYNLGDPIAGSFLYLYEPLDMDHFMALLDPKKHAAAFRERFKGVRL